MDLIEQSSLGWNSELFDKVFIDFPDMDIGEPIKYHKLINTLSKYNICISLHTNTNCH